MGEWENLVPGEPLALDCGSATWDDYPEDYTGVVTLHRLGANLVPEGVLMMSAFWADTYDAQARLLEGGEKYAYISYLAGGVLPTIVPENITIGSA